MKHISTLLTRLVLAFSLAIGAIVATAAAGTVPAANACESSTTWTPEMQAFLTSLPAVKEGQRNPYVLGLQLALKSRAYRLDGTGYFGPATKAAVQSWQRRNHINPSGLVGIQTWKTFILGKQYVPVGFAVQVSPGQNWPAHTIGDRIGIMRYTIHQLGFIFPTWAVETAFPFSDTGGVVTGQRYGGSEATNVKRLQSRVGINPSGIIGAKTSKALDLIHALGGGLAC